MTGKCYAMHDYVNQLAAANLMWLLCCNKIRDLLISRMHCWPRNCSVFWGVSVTLFVVCIIVVRRNSLPASVIK